MYRGLAAYANVSDNMLRRRDGSAFIEASLGRMAAERWLMDCKLKRRHDFKFCSEPSLRHKNSFVTSKRFLKPLCFLVLTDRFRSAFEPRLCL